MGVVEAMAVSRVEGHMLLPVQRRHQSIRASATEFVSMSENRSQEILYERLKEASDANLPALTILLARRYLADHPDDLAGLVLAG